MKTVPSFLFSLPLWLCALVGHAQPIGLTISEERILIPGGLQPFMFQAQDGSGTLVVQGATFPPDYVPATKNAYPGHPATIRSSDNGRTWYQFHPAPNQGIGPIFEGNATQLRDGTTMVLEWIADGPQSNGEFIGKVWESRDNWRTLSGPFEARILLPDAKGGFDDNGKPYGGVNLHRTLIEMPNGDLLSTAYGWFKGDNTPSAYMPNMMKFRSILIRSTDRGRYWTLVGTIAVDPNVGEEGFCEPVLVRLSRGPHEGRLIALLRTGSNKVLTESRYNLIYQSDSDDEGKTWTTPRPLEFQGVDPDLIELRNGILVAGFGWRTPESIQSKGKGFGPQHGNYLAFSFDQGATWTQVTQITSGLTTSYVTVREIEPNRLLLVYDKQWWRDENRSIAMRYIALDPLFEGTVSP